MRKLLITIFAVLALNGCTAFVPKFDNVEYNHFVRLSAYAQDSAHLCDQPRLMMNRTREMVHQAIILDTYASYRPAHKEIKEITSLVLANVKELDYAFWNGNPPSKAYCVGKLKVLDNSIKRALPVLGGLQQ